MPNMSMTKNPKRLSEMVLMELSLLHLILTDEHFATKALKRSFISCLVKINLLLNGSRKILKLMKPNLYKA